MYYGDSFADLATMRLEAKIKGIYAQAYREIEEKLNTFLAKSVIKEKEYEAKVHAGKLSQEWFDRWKSGQVFIGKRWRDLRQNISEEIYNSRKSATDMINDERKAVFQDNVNYAQYTIDKDHSFGISFTLYDNATVTRLIKEDPDLVPDVKYPDPQIDYAWSKKQITSAITQGILQGESIPELAKRVGKKLQSSNEKSMVRCARTAMTGAQNSGRIQAMHNAQDMGIQVQKVWIATLDDRTRDSHRDLDGQTIGVDEPFHSLYGEIMYPADPNAAPADTWNCFVGNTKVASDSGIIRSYKHDYSGELITVKTASGVKFTCTPNHPILTDRGWVGAKFLNNGDRLAETRCIKSDFVGVDPDIDHTLSCFDTIHKFFEKVGIKRTCSLGVNFHGDIPTTDVEIVSKERLLWNYRNSCEFQGKNKLGFKFTTSFVFSKGHFMSGFRRVHVSFLSLVSRMRQTLSFFLTRISHSGIHGLRTVSNMDSRIFESKRNSVSGNVQFISKSLAGLSSRVFFDNIVDIKTSSVSHVPVYNLQTQNGYYFVSSDSSIKSDSEKINGIFVIAHNCRCSLGYNYPKYSNQYDTRAARDVDWEDGGQTEQIQYMTFNEWLKWIQNGKPEPKKVLTGIEYFHQRYKDFENIDKIIEEHKRKIADYDKAIWDLDSELYDIKKQQELLKKDFSAYDKFIDHDDFEREMNKYKQRIEELTEQYYSLRKNRPSTENFATEEEFERAFRKYISDRNKIIETKNALEKEFYNYYSVDWNDIKKQRALKATGIDYDELYKEKERQIENAKNEKEKHQNELLNYRDLEIKETIVKVALDLEKKGVEYLDVSKAKEKNEDEIINKLAGGDLTEGSCASLAFCYAMQKNGHDVIDFRDGISRETFSMVTRSLLDSIDANSEKNVLIQTSGRYTTDAAIKALEKAEAGKEYYFCTGRHASIIKKDEYGMIQYLELQSGKQNGWKFLGDTDLNKKYLREMIKWRFGADGKTYPEAKLIDINDIAANEDMVNLMGYINTRENEQRKGSKGHER